MSNLYLEMQVKYLYFRWASKVCANTCVGWMHQWTTPTIPSSWQKKKANHHKYLLMVTWPWKGQVEREVELGFRGNRNQNWIPHPPLCPSVMSVSVGQPVLWWASSLQWEWQSTLRPLPHPTHICPQENEHCPLLTWKERGGQWLSTTLPFKIPFKLYIVH